MRAWMGREGSGVLEEREEGSRRGAERRSFSLKRRWSVRRGCLRVRRLRRWLRRVGSEDSRRGVGRRSLGRRRRR